MRLTGDAVLDVPAPHAEPGADADLAGGPCRRLEVTDRARLDDGGDAVEEAVDQCDVAARPSSSGVCASFTAPPT